MDANVSTRAGNHVDAGPHIENGQRLVARGVGLSGNAYRRPRDRIYEQRCTDKARSERMGFTLVMR